MREDLLKSGLEPEDIDARPLGDPERAMANVPSAVEGYVIPYYGIDGKPIPFYRVRLFNHVPKYKQLKDSVNHVYFPKRFLQTVQESNLGYIVLTEGEKKASKATKDGFPTAALTGVDSWKTRTLILPEATELSAAGVPGGRAGLVKAKLPPQSDFREDATLAEGFGALVDYAVANDKTLIICYDSDNGGTSYEVQRAAATLAYELRYRGIAFDHIRQLVLPPTARLRECKIGLDDFLMANGKGVLEEAIQGLLARRSAFPRHPNVREFLNKRLQNARLSRKDIQAVGLAILSDMDARGLRLRSSSDDSLFYFDSLSRKLIKVQLAASGREIMNDTEFARFLYNEYGISVADVKLMQWFATQFSSESPIDRVVPYRVLARYQEEDAIAYQINDGQYAKISATGLDILDNGTNGVMFESGHVAPIDPEKLLEAWKVQERQSTPKLLWGDVFKNVRLKQDPNLATATSLLYYLSPWLYRWRGTQLPIELVIGESGSGKSSLYELRLQILLGDPRLRNAPQDLKDWHASIANSGGLHVTDNVQLIDKNLRQRLSDELCRIVTEPNPHVEMRKLYSNAELMRIPITCTFAITAIQQPFINADLLQRSMIIELDKAVDYSEGATPITFDSKWAAHQLERFGTREEWIAHHLYVLHKFFLLVEKKWDPNYLARHRLINLEQAMVLMAQVFGLKSDWVPEWLSGRTEKSLSETDWALEGLMHFADMIKGLGRNYNMKHFSASEIASWAASEEDYQECFQLTNPRKLGRYLQTHKQMIQSMTGIVEIGKANNRMMYNIPLPRKSG